MTILRKKYIVRFTVIDNNQVYENVKGYWLDDTFLAFSNDGNGQLQRYFVPDTPAQAKICKERCIPYVEPQSLQLCTGEDRSFDGWKDEIRTYEKINEISTRQVLAELLRLSVADVLVNATYVSYHALAMDDEFYYRQQSAELRKRNNTSFEEREVLSHSISILRNEDGENVIIPLEENVKAVYVPNHSYALKEVVDDTYISKFNMLDWKYMNNGEILRVLDLYQNHIDKENEKEGFQKLIN